MKLERFLPSERRTLNDGEEEGKNRRKYMHRYREGVRGEYNLEIINPVNRSIVCCETRMLFPVVVEVVEEEEVAEEEEEEEEGLDYLVWHG